MTATCKTIGRNVPMLRRTPLLILLEFLNQPEFFNLNFYIDCPRGSCLSEQYCCDVRGVLGGPSIGPHDAERPQPL